MTQKTNNIQNNKIIKGKIKRYYKLQTMEGYNKVIKAFTMKNKNG